MGSTTSKAVLLSRAFSIISSDLLISTTTVSSLLTPSSYFAKKMTTSTPPHPHREFRFVPYGEPVPSDVITSISCDGKIPGATYDLTHWNGNDTPDDLYADTSTGMALKLAQATTHDGSSYEDWSNAIVLNNHYDTDGLLSVYACLYPQHALKHRQLLIHASEAGDFGEWSSDTGIQLECAITALGSMNNNDDDTSYVRALEILPDLLEDLQGNGGKSYEELWKPGFDEALASWDDIVQGRVKVVKGPGKMVMVHERDNSKLSPFALDRAMKESMWWDDTTRILRISRREDTNDNNSVSLYRYEYELIGHAWVHKLVDRPVIPEAYGENLAKQMGSDWSPGGDALFIAICTSRPTPTPPDKVSQKLWTHDPGCQ